MVFVLVPFVYFKVTPDCFVISSTPDEVFNISRDSPKSATKAVPEKKKNLKLTNKQACTNKCKQQKKKSPYV